ncbi:peptidase M13 [Buchananella hordeovulneris]|uniref:M13 family metallopeptidase n=1 Tax=Buchananella hordeovulneris TaxID=52770 RepID=UPI000F5F0827|nr:M13-type metalloendopeptidase [Buchananella hordeovulneris]RRD53396.1 peptidase M13 [Buchananella hordeovulneris]
MTDFSDPTIYDPNIRPQDDFYRHVQGTWLRDFEIPADRAMHGSFHELRDLAEAQVREIVEECAEAAGAGTATGAQARVGHLYRSFMDTEQVEKLGTAPLDRDFALIEQTTSAAELAAALGALARTGVASVVDFGAEAGFSDPEHYYLFWSQSGLGLPDEAYYREEKHAETLAKYREHVARQATNVGLGGAQFAARVVDFETALAQGHRDQVTARQAEKMNNPFTWTDFVAAHPGFNWEGYAAALSPDANFPQDLIVIEPEYFAHLATLWPDTDLAILQDYVRWCVVRSRAPYLSAAVVEENFDFFGRTLTGAEQLRDRWKRGVGLVEGAIGEEVGKVFVATHFPPTHKEAMQELVANLVAAYEESISALDWMGEATRAKALAKLAAFKPKIGYPDQWRDYSALTLGGELVENVRAASAFETDFQLGRIGQEVDPHEWLMSPQTVNAYYHPLRNEIVFPAAILRPPFFEMGADPALNYGAIGAVIGHEIGHGFDDQGSKYSGDGKLEDWWTAEDRAEFERRTSKLIEQYDAFVPAQLAGSEHHVNGALTVGENIGDLGGASIALKAYRLALAKEGIASLADAPVIDGLTAVQRFFYAYARIWRLKARDEALIEQISTDPHSPTEFRCNGIVVNLDEFAEAFDVQPGDGMWRDPADRVRIW